MLLYLRPITRDDTQILLEWRNDPQTRENSMHTEKISLETHLAWLEGYFNGKIPTRKIYIAEYEGVPVGIIRSDLENGFHELSWTVAPEMRHKGFGKAMVLQFVKEVLKGEKVIACIKKGHIASEKIAQALGLSEKGLEPQENPSNGREFVIWG